MLNGQSSRLIDLRGSIDNPVGRAFFRLVELPVEKALALTEINRIYTALQSPCRAQESYFAAALAALNVEYQLSAEDRAKIPATGPVILVANHPFGALEGLV